MPVVRVEMIGDYEQRLEAEEPEMKQRDLEFQA
jgi:hypothetical protein